MVPGARVAVGVVTGGDGLPRRSRLRCAGRGKVRGQWAQRRRAPHRGPMAAGPGTAPGSGRLRLRADLGLAPGWLRPHSAAAAGARALCRDALGLQRPRPERWGGGRGDGDQPFLPAPLQSDPPPSGTGEMGGVARRGPRAPPSRPCQCSLPSRVGNAGAAKHSGLLPCAIPQADPTRGSSSWDRGKATPVSPRLLAVGALQPEAGVVAQAGC